MTLGSVVRAAQLGFTAEPGTAGVVFVRRRAVAVAPAEPAEPTAPPGSPPAVALDIEAVSVASGHLAAFLVGLGVLARGEVLLEQLLLAEPAEEVALLLAVAARIRGAELVTYNGRGFDMRVLASRCVANGLHPATIEPRRHDDLLGEARRRYRRSLRSCTLQEVEAAVLGLSRDHDVPGREGPARYRAWLRGAPAAVLAGVVAHNEQDVVSTACLAAHLAAEAPCIAV